MDTNEILESARQELNAMADRCRDMAQSLEEIADRLPYSPGVTMERRQAFDEAVEKALRNILKRRRAENA